jgi:hypothetical protein
MLNASCIHVSYVTSSITPLMYHTSAYVSIRQHTSECKCSTSSCWVRMTYADVCLRMLYADECWHMLTYATLPPPVEWGWLWQQLGRPRKWQATSSAQICQCQHTSAYVSIRMRQHTSAFVLQDTSSAQICQRCQCKCLFKGHIQVDLRTYMGRLRKRVSSVCTLYSLNLLFVFP